MTVAFTCSGCSTEAASTIFYVYADKDSTTTTLDLLILTTAPNEDGFDSSNNKVLGKFFNNSSSDIDEDSVVPWESQNYRNITDNSIAIFADQKANNTSGGTCTSGSGYQTRAVNTTIKSAWWASIGSDRVTLKSGLYYWWSRHPLYAGAKGKTKLQNITAASTTVLGSNTETAAVGAQVDSVVQGIIDISADTVFEVQHDCTATSSDGFGRAVNNSDLEVYSQFYIKRLGE